MFPTILCHVHSLLAPFFIPGALKKMDITDIWGTNENIGPLEIAARSAVMFVYMILLLRMTGMRPFGKGDVFDTILTILFGAVLARGIVGATPFISAMVSGFVLVGIHFLLSRLTFYNKWIGRRIKGRNYLLYSNGNFNEENMRKTNITQNDIEEEMRINCQSSSMEKIKEVYLERTGEVSFVKK